ncbi:hypothetical protein BDF21DRAFT_439419 [Thamnidium elegans]|nr:hypothetical protein BDF21DRAFT_439419 [Thamnidium elegans]
MGSTQSKSAQPVIFYNQSSPLQDMKNPVSAEKIEQIVRERLAEELNRKKHDQEKANNRVYGDLAKKNIENDHNSIAIGEDIDSMVQKLQRSAPAEIPAIIAERQEELIICYK